MSSEPVGNAPYPSWTWFVNEIGIGHWSAPKPLPLEPGTWVWNEADQNWESKTN